jgi:methyltransferase family protein
VKEQPPARLTLVSTFLCGHSGPGRRDGYRDRCPTCGSFWDRDSSARPFAYDDVYPEQRSHLDPAVGALKVATLERWLRHLGLDVSALAVCEVGFGGPACLSFLNRRAAWAGGIEVVDANLGAAAEEGVPADRLFHGASLPASLDRAIDLWIFQDSFEHLPDPAAFVAWMTASSSARARILIVAPRAGSTSERLLGRLWPHKLPDHHFHWSKAGILGWFAGRGFDVDKEFRPDKVVSGGMVLAHLAHKLGLAGRGRVASLVPALSFSFNLGEMGLLLRRR